MTAPAAPLVFVGELHAVRIKVKRARYAAELALAVVGRPAERFVSKARKLQASWASIRMRW